MMAVASWMISGRSLRNGRNNKGRLGVDEDLFKLDSSRSTKQNACDILRGLCCKFGVFYDTVSGKSPHGSPIISEGAGNSKSLSKTIISDAKRLSYLSALVKLLSIDETKQKLGFTTEEILCCLRVSLVHESTQVRAGTLRAVRYALHSEADVIAFNSLRLPFLVTRCMDVVLRNEMERIQALRVVRRVLRLGAGRLEAALARALLAVPGAAPEDKDRLMRACLAVLCELGVLNSTLFIETGGVAAITRAILDCQTPRIAESLCGVLLHLLNLPSTRLLAKVDLRCLAAPYCDFHYRHGWMDKNRDEREMRFTCSRLSLLSVLRSWPGLLHFCDPMNESGLRAIVDVLYLNQLEVRKAILDLLYELLGLPQPDWTDELSVALTAVDPSDFQDSWRLNEGFVAAEGRSILPHLAATGPNLIELHLALLLYCFLEVGLLDALVEVMVTSDTFISVRATVLLGQLLHLIHLLLPPDTCNISPPLPTLLARAAAAHPQALAAVAALQSLNSLLMSRPASSSLFLDHILQCCDSSSNLDNTLSSSKVKTDTVKGIYKYPEDSMDLLNDADFELEQPHRRSLGSKSEYSNKNEDVLIKSKSVSARTSAVVSKVVKTKKLFNLFDNLKDTDSLIKESNVLQNKVGFAWDWNIIRAILKSGVWGVEQALLVRRLVHYLRPSSNRFSHTDLLQTGPLHIRDQALAALHLVTYLLQLQQAEGLRLLQELFLDIAKQVEAISEARSAHECLFSPQHMTTTMCQLYFLFIGRLCSTREGLRLFRDTGLYESLLRLAITTHHSCYVKLIISSLDYTLNSYPRQILSQTLRCNVESSRLYATQFLNVLLRARQSASKINYQHNGPRKRDLPDMEPSQSPFPSDTEMSRPCPAEVCSDMDGWMLDLLVKQARDESKAVSICALNILDEACNVPAYLNKLVSMKPRLKDLGDKGYLVWIRFAGTVAGFQALTEAGYVRRQIRYWVEHYNYRYTRLVEGEIHECLTLLQRAEDGRYRRRVSTGPPPPRVHTPPPPHLYAQLALHPNGRDMLARHGDLPVLAKCVKQGLCFTEQEVMDLKSALWACGHMATSASGVEVLISLGKADNNVFIDTVKLAQTCPVYSIRGTAFYVLGLMGCTYEGANVLHGLGWLCVRHNRHERWPIIHEETWLTKTASEDQIYSNMYQTAVPPDLTKTMETGTSEDSDKMEHSTTEGCRSDIINPVSTKSLVTSTTMEQSLTEESCDSCEGDILDERVDLDKSNFRSVSESSDRPEKRSKCKTLPQRPYPGTRKHQRSLSESKTVDKLKSEEDSIENVYERSFYIGPISENRPMIRRLNSFDLFNEGILRRIRNTSESSTSGVSSCDSVLGKYVYNDRILTLSPIPSSSSLSAMKSIIPNKRQSEATRRISLHSYTGSDVASSPPSQRDLVGYATLRSLSRHRRPTYSEATVDELSSFLNSETKKIPVFGSLKGKSKLTEAKNTRMSLFKYDWKPIGSTADSRISPNPPTKEIPVAGWLPAARARLSGSSDQPGPIYMGISMPRCLLDIFPSRTQHISSTTSNNYMAGTDSFTVDGDNVTHQDIEVKKNDDSNFNSSFSDLSVGGNGVKSSSRMTRGRSRECFSKHDQLSCLYCSRLKPAVDGKKTSDLREAFFTGIDSPNPSGSGSSRSAALAKSPAPTNSLTYASLDVSCGSPASLDSNLSKMSDGNPNIAEEIIKHAERMGNPIWHKQSRQALLGLKQKYPEVFQNICLYSEICKLVSQSTYRLNARRFLQELFLDLNFDVLYLEPQHIIQSKTVELEVGL